MRGSYQNALDSLIVKSSEWKITTVDNKTGQCEWGFRVVLECKDSPNYQDDKFGGRAVMPIEKLEYTLYDKDNFHLTTLVLNGKDLVLCFRDTQTFQQTRKDSLALLKRACYGHLNIKAGYNPEKKTGPSTTPRKAF